MSKSLLIFMLLLGGCTTNQQWAKAGATPADVKQAQLECEYEAAKSTNASGKLIPETGDWIREGQLQVLCLRAKGFTNGSER